jgi:hypothetical protein
MRRVSHENDSMLDPLIDSVNKSPSCVGFRRRDDSEAKSSRLAKVTLRHNDY